MSTAFFHTHHSPIGAWASLTFGMPGVGVSIDHQDPTVKNSGALLAGIIDSTGMHTIGFADAENNLEVSLTAEGDKEKNSPIYGEGLSPYHLAPPKEITRTLTPSTDTYQLRQLTFTTYTPYTALPDPQKETILAKHCLPGILMDLTADNRTGKEDITVFFGLLYNQSKKLYASSQDEMVKLSFRGEWEFSASQKDGVTLLRGLDAPSQLLQGTRIVQQNGPTFFCLKVPAGEIKTLSVSFAVYAREGSNGLLSTEYYYCRYFQNLHEVSKEVLQSAPLIRQLALCTDAEWTNGKQDPKRVEFFSQALRAYYASSQLLIDKDDKIHWNSAEGAYLWRNTMDLCADHITWELKRNPWIVRSLMDDFLTYYTYTDRVTFPGKKGDYPGGMSFTHDMGCYFTYSSSGYSAYERTNDSSSGFYFYMTTEELLNGIYCICSYVLTTKDVTWLQNYPTLLNDLMTSLENRDAPTPAERNGILKASSLRGGSCSLESTTYDALDHSLLEASGNLYVFIKTWCALVLLLQCNKLYQDPSLSSRATEMLEKCRASAFCFQSKEHAWLKANAYKDIPGAVSAAAEPLAVPYMLGVFDQQKEPYLFSLLRDHLNACLQNGICIDALSGGLRLSSTSRNTWPSKSVLTLYAAETVLGLKLPFSLIEETIHWAQRSAAKETIADQILCDTRQIVGAPYYPRIVTAVLWL